MADLLIHREIRRVHLPGGPVPLGALAGTDTAHPFVPDGGIGTSCLLCFGWCSDPRHAGHRSVHVHTVISGGA
jgi:hypothetical protein